MPTRTAAIYCRISLDRTGAELGVQRQEEECRAFCERQGLEVLEVHVDNDMSATKGLRRPGFEALFESKAQVWVAWATDRLVRTSKELLRVIEAGATVYTVQAGPIDLATPSGRMVGKMLTAVAELEGEQRSARQRSAFAQIAKSGKPRWCRGAPYGHRMDGSLEPAEANLIAEGANEILRGKNLADVAKLWTAGGFLRRNGTPWTPAHVGRLIISDRLAGLRTYQGKVVGRGDWEPILSEEILRGVRAALKASRRSEPQLGRPGTGGSKPLTLLSQIASCANCGSHLKGGPGYRGVPQYVCAAGGCCKPPREWLDALVFREVVKALPSDPARWPGRTGSGSDDAAARLRGEQSELKVKLTELGEAYAAGSIPLEALSAASQGVSKRLEDLEVELGKAQASWSVLEAVQDFEHIAHAWDVDLSLTQRRTLVTELFSKISVRSARRGPRRGYTRDNVIFERREKAQR